MIASIAVMEATNSNCDSATRYQVASHQRRCVVNSSVNFLHTLSSIFT